MAANAISILISITEKGQGIISSLESGLHKLNSASKAYQSTIQSVNGHVDKFQQGLQRLVSAVAGFNIAKSFLDTASSFEKTKLMLEGLSGSSEQAEKDFAWIRDFAAKTPFDMQSISDAFVKLRTAGLEPTEGSMRTLVDAIAAFGGGSDELNRAVIAIAQMSGKGVISMEELRQQLGETMPTAMKVMAREMGMSMAELVKLISSGSLDAQTGLKALFEGLEKDYSGAAYRMMKGWTGVMAQLKSSWQTLQDTLMSAGVFEALKDTIKGITDELKTPAFAEFARNVGDALAKTIVQIVEFGKIVYEFFKNMGVLGDIFLSLRSSIVSAGLALLTIKVVMTAMLSIPLLLYRNIMALHAGFVVLTGLTVVSWFKTLAFQMELLVATFVNLPAAISTVVGALGVLGLALASVWAVGKIAELIKAIKDLFATSEQLDTVKKRYQSEAEALKDFRDFKIRTLQDFKLMEDERLREEKESLEKSIQYWAKYKEGLQLQFEQLYGGPATGPEGGFVDLEAMEAAKAAMADAQAQIDALMGEMAKLGEAARANGVDLHAQADAVKDSGEAARSVVPANQQAKMSFVQVQQAVQNLSREHQRLSKTIGESYDFEAEKAKAAARDEKAAANAVMEIYRKKKDALIQAAEDTANKQASVLAGSTANDEQAADTIKKIHEELRDAKIKAIEDYQGKLKSSLLQALTDEKKYADEVKKLQNELRTAQMSYQEKVRDLQRKTMTEEQAWVDRKKEALSTQTAAQNAFAKALSETDPAKQTEGYQEAIDLAKKAQSQAQSLAVEIKDGDKTIITMQQGVNEAMKIMAQTEKTIEDAIKKQIELAKTNEEESKKRIQNLQAEIDKIAKQLKEINDTPIAPKAKIELDSREVDDKLRELDGKVTRSTHIIEVREQGGGSGGRGGSSTGYTYGDSDTYEGSAAEKYWREYYGFRLGGLIPAVRRFAEGGFNRIRGALGGWGGGDRIRALLEAGEFVIRKEAVAKYGAGFFELLNNMRLNLPDVLASIAMPPQVPRAAYAEGGPVVAAQSGGARENITWRWQIGDKEFPLSITAPRGTASLMREMEEELSRAGLTRSRV